MLALNVELGSVTDFYVKGKHLVSFKLVGASDTEEGKDTFLETHPEFESKSEFEPEIIAAVSSKGDRATIRVEGRTIDLNFYLRHFKGSMRRIVSFGIDDDVRVIRREVLEREGVNVCLHNKKAKH